MQLYQILYRFTILFLFPARFVNISVPHLLFTENLPEKSESFIAETGKMCYDGSAQYKRTIKIYALGGDNNMSSESIQKSKEEVQIRDQIKNEYCKNHNIVLVRIPYWQYNQITDILTEHHII